MYFFYIIRTTIMIQNKTSCPEDFKLSRFYCIIYLNWILYCSRLNSSRHSNRPLPQQPQEPARHSGTQSGAGDYASLTRYREKPSSKNYALLILCMIMNTHGQIQSGGWGQGFQTSLESHNK